MQNGVIRLLFCNFSFIAAIMAEGSNNCNESIPESSLNSLKYMLWGSDIKHDVFRRWSQGFVWSDSEPCALEQFEGGPCAVIAPVQAFVLQKLMFDSSQNSPAKWKTMSGELRNELFGGALLCMLEMLKTESDPAPTYYIVSRNVHEDTKEIDQSTSQNSQDTEESSPKKQCFSHEEFHSNLKCAECRNREELKAQIVQNLPAFQGQYGVMLLLYSFIITKGIEQIKNELEDPGDPLIDGIHGHGSQSLINLLITGKAVSNVWDKDKDVSGLKLRGISNRPSTGFLTLLEHLRYLEVGWYLKNPEYPIWLLGSETHITVLFSQDKNLVGSESPESEARRVFNDYDKEGSGFIIAEVLGDLMSALDLVSEPEYVKIMKDKLDPEKLGIVTLNSFMEEFFPSENSPDVVNKFTLYHYNGLKRSCRENKVTFHEGVATIMETPELQIITDTSPIKLCLMTKWPTLELKWTNDHIPSLN